MAGAMTHVEYTSDDGGSYRVRQDSSNATDLGNPTATSPMGVPPGYKPRYILATRSNGRARKLVVCDPTSDLWLGTQRTVTIWDYSTNPSTHLELQVLSRVGERRLNTG
jgi:hypothetical protein